MGLFDFLNEYNALYSNCTQFEKMFILYDKLTVAAESRKILEQFTIAIRWKGIRISERIKYATENHLINDDIESRLQKLVHCGNYGHHFQDPEADVSTWANDKTAYNSFNKKENILSELVSLMLRIKTGTLVNVAPEMLMTQTFHFADRDYTLVNQLEPVSYSHFLFRKDNNPNSRVIIRFISGPNLDSENRAKRILSGKRIESDVIISENILYDAENEKQQILALELSENQRQLFEIVHDLDFNAKFSIIYQLIENIIKPMLELENGSAMICHRNINPNTIIIQADDWSDLSNGFKVRLSCFEHSKVNGSLRTVNVNRNIRADDNEIANYNTDYPYGLYVNADNNGSISIENSKVMDAYSVARLFLYLFSNSPTNTAGLDNISEFTRQFISGLKSYLEVWVNGSRYFRSRRQVTELPSEFHMHNHSYASDKFHNVDAFYKLITDEYHRINNEPTPKNQNISTNAMTLPEEEIAELNGIIESLNNKNAELAEVNNSLQIKVNLLRESNKVMEKDKDDIANKNTDLNKQITAKVSQIKGLKIITVMSMALAILFLLLFLFKGI